MLKILQTVLSFVYSLDNTFGVTSRIVLCFGFGMIHLFLHVYYLPFYKPVMNSASVAFASVFLWATVLLTVATLRQRPEVPWRPPQHCLLAPLQILLSASRKAYTHACPHGIVCPPLTVPQDNAEAAVFLCMLPGLIFLGTVLVRLRFDSFRTTPAVINPFMVALRLFPHCYPYSHCVARAHVRMFAFVCNRQHLCFCMTVSRWSCERGGCCRSCRQTSSTPSHGTSQA